MTRTDLTVFLSGAAVALTAGVLLGGAMQPHLDRDDSRPAGPQMFAAWDGHSTGPFDPGESNVTLAAYHGNPPDYVLGTDWKKAMTWPDEQAAVSARREAAPEPPPPAEPPPVLARVVYEGPPPPTHDYPSMNGAHPTVIEIPPVAEASEDPPAGGR
jgi:hypothetical protein